MLQVILVVLMILWLLGYVTIPGIHIPNWSLFYINGHSVTLWHVLLLIVIAWAIEELGGPLRQIAIVLLVLWILSVLGIIAVAGLSNLLVLAIIVGVIWSLIKK